MKNVSHRRFNLLSKLFPAVSVAMMVSSLSAQASTSTWTGGTTGTWAGSTWTGTDIPPTATDTAQFGGTTAETASVNGSAQAIGGITVSNTAPTIITNNSNTAGSLTIGSGGLTIASGSGAVTLENATAATTGALTLNLGASQAWTNNSANALTVSSNITNTSASTLTLGGTGAGAINITGAITDGTGATALTVASGATGGAVNLSAANTYSGATTVASGTLNVNFAGAGAPTNNIINSASALNMGGGNAGPSTLLVTGGAGATNSQSFASTTFNQGASTLSISNGATANTAVNLGAITRNEGSAVNFVSPSGNTTVSATNGFTTTTANTNGILGGALTYNGNDWATNNGTNIVAYTGYTSVATGSTPSWTPTQNISIDSGGTGTIMIPSGTANAPTTTTINSLRINNAGGVTTVNSGTSTFSVAGYAGGSTFTPTSGTTAGFFVGETISAPGTVPAGDYIVSMTATTITLANPVTSSQPGGATFSATSGILSIGSGGILETSNVGAVASTISVGELLGPANGDLVITQNNGTAATSGLTISSAINNNGGPLGLTKAGAGYLTLTNAASNFTGPVSVDGGTLEIDPTFALGATYVGSGAVLTELPSLGTSFAALSVGPITGGGTIKYGSNSVATGTFNINETASTTFSGTITGVLAGGSVGNSMIVDKNGAGTLNLTAAGGLTNYRGFVVNAGTLEFSGNGTLADLGTFGTTNSRLTMAISQGASVTLDDTVTNVASRLSRVDESMTLNGGTFNLFGSSTAATVETIQTKGTVSQVAHGLIMGAGSDVVNATAGSGQSTALTFNDVYARNAGSVALFEGTNLGSTPGSNVATVKFGTAPTLTGGATAGTASYGVMAGTFVDSVSTGGTNTYSIATYDSTNGVRALNSTTEQIGTLTAGDNVLATSALTNGTLAINSLTLGTGGSIDNTAGTLTVTSGNILSTGANTSIGSGGGSTLNFGATGTSEGVIYTAPSSTLTIGATLSGTGGLTTGGAGTTVLTANNASTLTGTVTIDSSTLSISAANNLGAAANAIAINNGGELQSTGGAVTLGSGAITLGGTTANTITSGDIDVSGAATNVLTQGTGIIGGVGGLTKSGVGVLTLTQANTWAGPTQIIGGTVNLTTAGSIAATSTVTVGASGTLAGSGTINGALITSSGSNVTPGAVGTVGTLHVGSLGFQISAGTNFNYDLASTVTAGGTTNDLIALTGGTLTIGGSGIVFNFSDTSLATTGSYTLISGATSIAGFSASDFSATGIGGDTATFSTSGNNLYVSFTAGTTPPPSTSYYFTGSTSGSFTDGTNYVTTAAGGTAQTGTLTSTSDVFLNANTTTPANTPATLNASTTINSLTYLTSGTSLAGSGTVTIDAASGAGITDSATGGTTETVNPMVALGASQGWTVSNSTNTLTVAGGITGSAGQTLTLNGPGTFNFSSGVTGSFDGANTTVASGKLLISNGTTGSSGSALGTGTFTVARGATFGGAGTASGLNSFIIGSGSAGTAQIQVGNGIDTTSKLFLSANNASTISNANLAFNLSTTNTNANLLNLGNTPVTFSNTTLSLNMVGGTIVSPDTSYVLLSDANGFTNSGLTITNGIITGGLSIAANSFFGAEGANGQTTGFYNGSYLFLTDGGDEIAVEVVPEPGTWAMMVGGIAVLFFWQRRRSSRIS